MIYCRHCGHPNRDGAQFCGACGQPLVRHTRNTGNTTNSGNQRSTNRTRGQGGTSWIDSINEYLGNDRPAELNWRMLFSDVFKHHTTEEAEEIFICGTKDTTPDPYSVSKDWPHPWLYSRVLLMFTITFVLLWICVNTFASQLSIPGLIVIGSFAVPLSTMVLFLEANVWKNVSMYTVIKTFFMGGCASLVVTLFLFSVYGDKLDGFFGAFIIGLIEETGKAVIVFAILRRFGKLSILTGMLIGSAVGAGFAAFESAGYALRPLLIQMQYTGYAAAYGKSVSTQDIMDSINHLIFMRAVLAPGGHVAWAAISGAAFVIASKLKGVFDTSLFTETKFLRLFAIPIVLHGLWDSPLAEWINKIFPYGGYISLIVIVWIVVMILINMGLAEVSQRR